MSIVLNIGFVLIAALAVWWFDCSLSCVMTWSNLPTILAAVIPAFGGVAFVVYISKPIARVLKPALMLIPGVVLAFALLTVVPALRPVDDYCCIGCRVTGDDLRQVAEQLIKAEREAVLNGQKKAAIDLYLPEGKVTDHISGSPNEQSPGEYYDHLMTRYKMDFLKHDITGGIETFSEKKDVMKVTTTSQGEFEKITGGEKIEFRGSDIWYFDRSHRCCGWRIRSLDINVHMSN